MLRGTTSRLQTYISYDISGIGILISNFWYSQELRSICHAQELFVAPLGLIIKSDIKPGNHKNKVKHIWKYMIHNG